MSMQTRPLYIPVILGTVRQGRASQSVARFSRDELAEARGRRDELIDIREIAVR